MVLMRDGDLRRFETLVNRNIDLCRKIGVGYVFMELAWRGMAQLYQGRFDEAIASFRESADEEASEEGGVVARGTGAASLFYGLAYADPDHALGYYESTPLPELLGSRNEPYHIGEWTAMLHVGEALVLLGQEDEAAGFYPDFVRAIERNLFSSLWSNGLVEKLAGMTAACACEWDRAERHFENALEQAERLPHRIDQPETRRWYAWMLRKRGRRGEDSRASELESEALELYQELGMTRHVAMLSRDR